MLAAVYEANPFAPASRISAPGRGGGRTERGDALSPHRARAGGGEPPALLRRSAPRRSAPRAAMAGGRGGGGGERRREGGGRTADSGPRGPLRARAESRSGAGGVGPGVEVAPLPRAGTALPGKFKAEEQRPPPPSLRAAGAVRAPRSPP